MSKKNKILRMIMIFPFIVFPVTIHSQTAVVVDPSIKYQKFEGWGTSLCWWAVQAGKWSEANRARLIGAIVDPDTGLGYTIFRYNIGGGDNKPGHSNAHLNKSGNSTIVPGYKPTESGPYDWNADPGQRAILLGIHARVKEPIYEAFSNSPPWWMTKSGCTAGNTDGSENLKDDYYDDFAEYLTEVVKHFKDTWNITFRTIEPFNEPSSNWWKAGATQEGCKFSTSYQSKMIVELGKSIAAKGLSSTTTVSASDETSITMGVTSANAYTQSALSYLSQLNVHSYSGGNDRAKFAQKVSSLNKRLWQSEAGPLGGTGGQNIALFMADVIIRDLRDMKSEAWLDWQVCDMSGGDWCTIKNNLTAQTFSYNVRYYMHAAFSRFIKPGSQIISSNNANTIAALVPNGNLVIVTRNGTTTSSNYVFDLSKCSPIGASAKVYLFSLPGSLTTRPDVQISNKQLNIASPAQSVVTCVIPGATTPIIISTMRKAQESKGPSFHLTAENLLCIQATASKRLMVTIFALDGKKVLYKKINISETGKADLALNRLKTGIYMVKLEDNGLIKSGYVNLR
ncbi:MAG: T9SS type A sorting domain-containing protein [Chitinispirillaceae bacterium]|nr:T9SS type A sorting domain-containing protein [Chitinispirillaceae bacterium]